MIDQPHNAKLLVEAGMAINLMSSAKRASHDLETNKCTFETPVFQAQEFAAKVKTLLSDPKYKENALRMKAISRVAGGSKKAVMAVE